MEHSRRYSFDSVAPIVLVVLIVPGLLLIGCNNSPNTNANLGPTILLTLSASPGYTWPPHTPNLVNNQLSVLATATGPAGGAQIQWFPSESKPPYYDWLVSVAPADKSGIRSLTVQVNFFSDCGGQGSSAYPEALLEGSQSVGSPTGPVLNPSPLYIVELSPTVLGTYHCSTPNGTSVQGGEVALYYITATSTNGNGKTTNTAFLIKIGNVDAINYGP